MFGADEVYRAVPPPRGLTWAGAEVAGAAVTVRRPWRSFAAVPAVLSFEPVPGSDMEDVPAARDPRRAVVVLTRRPWGRWRVLRVVFNLDAATVAKMLT